MFDDLRAAFREALDNFNKELRRDQVTDTADRLLVGMRDEIVAEKAQVAGLEEQLEKALAEASAEKDRGGTCRRREQMARRIGDEETATVAAQHALKHEGHSTLLLRKADALREELEFRRGTVEEMVAGLTEARQKRDALAAASGRASARGTFAGADDLFSELDRMADKRTRSRDAEPRVRPRRTSKRSTSTWSRSHRITWTWTTHLRRARSWTSTRPSRS
jgi:hypothetical protein